MECLAAQHIVKVKGHIIHLSDVKSRSIRYSNILDLQEAVAVDGTGYIKIMLLPPLLGKPTTLAYHHHFGYFT